MTPAERLDELALRGVQVYLDDEGRLTAKCEPEFTAVLDAALPALRKHKVEIIRELERRVAVMS